jgi:hypothetical protein
MENDTKCNSDERAYFSAGRYRQECKKTNQQGAAIKGTYKLFAVYRASGYLISPK